MWGVIPYGGTNMTIIPMKEEHLPQLVQLEQACFSTPWSLTVLTESFHQENIHFWVALEEETLLGSASVSVVLSEGYINNVAVFPQYQNKGIAGKLLDAMIEFAKDTQKPLDFLTLEVRESNVQAIALYKSRGFQQIALRKNYYEKPQEHALMMNLYTNPTGGNPDENTSH